MNKYTINANEDSDLPNKLNLTENSKINEVELVGVLGARLWAIETLAADTTFSLSYLYEIHRRAFGELYDFAGNLRTVDMSKDGFSFPSAKFLPQSLATFESTFLEPINKNEWKDDLVLLNHIAAMHAELLYIHPFREGNGRTIRLFTDIISLLKRGEELNFEIINRGDNFQRYIRAVQEAAAGKYTLMQELFLEL